MRALPGYGNHIFLQKHCKKKMGEKFNYVLLANFPNYLKKTMLYLKSLKQISLEEFFVNAKDEKENFGIGLKV